VTPAHSIAEDDCLRTATASILDMNPRRVPHFVRRKRKGEYWFDVWDAWLRSRGLRAVPHYFATLADAPSGWWIAITDEDPTDDWTHALVMRGRRVAWDAQPNPPRRRNYIQGYTIEPVR